MNNGLAVIGTDSKLESNVFKRAVREGYNLYRFGSTEKRRHT